MSGRSGATRKLAAKPPRELLTGTYSEHISKCSARKVVSEPRPPMPESGHPTCLVMTCFSETESRNFKGLLLIFFGLARTPAAEQRKFCCKWPRWRKVRRRLTSRETADLPGVVQSMREFLLLILCTYSKRASNDSA